MSSQTPDDWAAAVADGEVVDWDALASRASSPRERRQIEQFALLARLAGVYGETPPDLPAGAQDDWYSAPRVPGDTWGPLRILERLGAGTSGTVYRAHDPVLARDVALKLLHLPAATLDLVAEALREGRLLARVRHPNVVTVYGADHRDGLIGLWMELIQGRTLEQDLAQPWPVAAVAQLGRDLAGALEAVHAAGLVHRDVKAQNVMRDARDGRVVLMDFSAGHEQREPGRRWPATLVGSPLYLAPELMDGAPASARSDLYSLGVLMFRLVTGRFPIEARGLDDIVRAHARPLPSVRSLRADAEARVATAIDRLLATDPHQRYASAAALGATLEDAGAAPDRGRTWTRRDVVAAALATLGITSAGVWHVGRSPSSLAFAARDWVLIGAFDNATGDASFDDVLERALMRELASSRHVNVVPRARVEDALALMRQPLDARLDVDLARQVARRDGRIRAVLAGRIARVGSAYVLTTDVLDPVDGALHARFEDEVPTADGLLAGVREQALRVRHALGESLPAASSKEALAQVTTPSLDALQLYSRAAALLEGDAWLTSPDVVSRYEAADALLAGAVERDPSFASAWLLRARAASARGVSPDVASSHAARAVALAPQVSVVERYYIEGVAHRMHADAGPHRSERLTQAAHALEALLHLVPDHYWALIEIEPIYRRLRRTADAERVALQAASLRPNSLPFATAAARVHLGRRNRPALRRTVLDVLARVPPGLEVPGNRRLHEHLGFLRMWEAREAWIGGDMRRLELLLGRYSREAPGIGNPALIVWTGAGFLGLGRIEPAREVVAKLSDAGSLLFYRLLLDTYWEAWDRVRPQLLARQDDFAFVHRFSFMYIWAGLTDVAEWLVAERQRRAVRMDWQFQQEFVAQLRVAQGRYAEALELFAPILQDVQFPKHRMNELVSLARRGVGDLEGAIAQLEPFDADPLFGVGMEWGAFVWLSCQVRLAEYYVEAGRRADAARVAAKLRPRLARADRDHPLLPRLASLP